VVVKAVKVLILAMLLDMISQTDIPSARNGTLVVSEYFLKAIKDIPPGKWRRINDTVYIGKSSSSSSSRFFHSTVVFLHPKLSFAICLCL
jgi:hypothetical protein